MPEATPELSVVIPAYNAQITIVEQIAALTADEAAFAWELIVADNGSTDDTAEVVLRLRKKVPQLRLIDASGRRGPSAARNLGFAAAKAPFVAFCDADDIVVPGWVTAARQGLDSHGFVSGYRETIGRNQLMGPLVHSRLPWLPYTGTQSLGIRRDVFERIGGFDESLATDEDNDLAWRVQLAGERLVFLSGMTVRVRPRSTFIDEFRQAFSWGVNERQLAYKFAPIISAYQRQTGETAPHPTRVSDAARAGVALARCAYRLLRSKGRGDLAPFAFEPGVRLGQAFGRVDRTSPQLPVPDGLLPVWTAIEPQSPNETSTDLPV